jgi:CheY-like chemotaxis protein
MAQLTACGMQVECVADGTTALARLHAAHLKARQYALVILDYHMPGMDGITLARTIKADPIFSPIRLIMLSSLGQRLPAHATPHLDIAAYVTKPIRQSQLYHCLATVMQTAATPVPSPPETAGTRPAALPQLRARVLLAEDNVVNQKVAVRMLERLGCRVDVAANGHEAIAALTHTVYDCVLMDCQMPEMDGYEATAAIRQREAGTAQRTPIVAMTANAIQGDREHCLAMGMDDYVSKPIRPQELTTVLQKWVRPW